MKRIFMISSQLMFSQGVENLLIDQPGLEIAGRESDVSRAIEAIHRLQPDVVIVDSKDMASAPASIVASALKVVPTARVILLNLENDQIRVYQGMQRTARGVNDLLDAMEAGSSASESGHITSQEWMALAAGRAAEYGFHAAIYNRPIDETLLENLSTQGLYFTHALETSEDLTGDLQAGQAALERFYGQLDHYSQPVIHRGLAQEYTRLLAPSAPEGLGAQACEAAYSLQIDHELLYTALLRVYRMAGMELPVSLVCRPDFIGSELEFMQRLCLQEVAAWQHNDYSAARIIQAMESAFLKEHLIRWVPRCCEFIITHTRLDFYRGMAYLTKGFILNEAYRVAELMEWNILAEGGSMED